jgi:hypothetical protein
MMVLNCSRFRLTSEFCRKALQDVTDEIRLSNFGAPQLRCGIRMAPSLVWP